MKIGVKSAKEEKGSFFVMNRERQSVIVERNNSVIIFCLRVLWEHYGQIQKMVVLFL